MGMNLAISLETLTRLGSDPLAFRSGDKIPLEVAFYSEGRQVELPSQSQGMLGIKETATTQPLLVLSTAWNQNGIGSSASYSFDIDLDTEELLAALGNKSQLSCLMEIQWTVDGYRYSSVSVPIVITPNLFDALTPSTTKVEDYKAAQADAETGTNNSKWMTPLRTAQAIASKGYATASALSSAISALVTGVSSVAGKTGAVSLVKGDVGLGSVDNTSDASKPISTATQNALDGKQASGSYAPSTHNHTLSELTQSSATIGQVPSWNGTAWVPAAAAPSSHTHTLSELTQSSATIGQVPSWNGTAWVPAAPAGEKGDKGDPGDKGDRGEVGSAPWRFVGPYNNGVDYGLGDAVTYLGGFYYRTGNPLNPGYPPEPGIINASWTPVADGVASGSYITTNASVSDIRTLTQTQYNALAAPGANPALNATTLYIITSL